jgi:hypothetical protein
MARVKLPATVTDQASPLQGIRHDRNARSLHSEHFAKELVRKRNVIAEQQIPAAQQPA